MPLKEANVPEHRWYQKRYNARLARDDYSKDWIYPSGLRRIDEAFMRAEGYMVSNHAPKTMADFKNGVYVVDGIQTTFSAAFQHTTTSNATMTGGYGDELVTNGTFEAGSTGWSVGTNFSVSNGVATLNSDGSASQLSQANVFEIGKTYEVVFHATVYSGSAKMEGNGGSVAYTIDATGWHKFQFTADLTTLYFNRISACLIDFDNISVREAPKVQWRPHNLIRWSEELSGGDWGEVRATVTTNALTSPDTLATADLLTENTDANSHYTQQTFTAELNVDYTMGVCLKSNGRNRIMVRLGSSNLEGSLVDLSSGTILDDGSRVSESSITDLGDGWYYVLLTANNQASTSPALLIGLTDDTPTTVGVQSYTGDGSSGVYVWGVHVFRNDLGGMADVPASERVLPALTKYVRTAGRVIGEDLVTNGDFSDHADELVSDGTFDARGDELVTGGTFQNGVDPAWTQATGPEITIDVQGGRAVLTNTVNSAEWYRQVVTVESGKVYEFRGTIQDGTSSDSLFRLTGATNLTLLGASTEATVTQYFTASSTTLNLDIRVDSLGTGYFDNISVREVLADWSVTSGGNATVDLENGAVHVDTAGDAAGIQQNILTSGVMYEVTFDYEVTTGALKHSIGTSEVTGITGSGTYSHVFEADGTSFYIFRNASGVAAEFTVDNISVKEAVPGWSVTDGTIQTTDDGLLLTDTSGTFGYAAHDFPTVAGNTYRLLVDLVDVGTAPSAYVQLGTPAATTSISNTSIGAKVQTYEQTFVATETTTRLQLASGATVSSYATWNNIKVEEVDVDPSSARYMARIGHRVFNGQQWVNEGLELESEARTNLFTNSNASFSAGTGVTYTYDELTSPSGLVDATLVTTDTSTGLHSLPQSHSFTLGDTHTVSYYVKKGTQRYIAIQAGNPATWGCSVLFDLDTGAVDTETAGFGTISNEGNGWYRIAATGDALVTGSTNILLSMWDDSKNQSWTGTGSETVYVAHRQNELASTPSSYIPTSGSTVTRAAETLVQTGDKAPWPTAVYADNLELVTNGTFDTDTDWTKGTGWTISGGTASCDGTQVSTSLLEDAALSATSGSVYEVQFTLSNYSAGNINVNFGGGSTSTVFSDGTYTQHIVATSTATFKMAANSTFVGDIDNISVKEINPRALSVAVEGRITYADEDTFGTAMPLRQHEDTSNNIELKLDTDSTKTGQLFALQDRDGTTDFSTMTDQYLPGLLVPYNVAGRFVDDDVQLAADGAAYSSQAGVGLPDLETTDLDVGYDYMGTIRTFRMFDQDIGETGLVSSTEPSLEPTLSLVFDGSGDSYIDFDWSE